ncbi:DNA cytosine methyltransferase, partial [Staphylococcus aureus]|nr:DNA cytosine methyltransferase [Staphylococcus aureus]
SHQPRRLAGGDQPAAHLLAVDHDDHLAAGAAGRCPQAAGDIVEPDFRTLMGLDESYKLPKNYNEAYHLTGDGVAVHVVRHLAEQLFEPL